MTDGSIATLTHASGTAGGEALSTSILQLVSDSMAELAGFELARICLARHDGLRNAVVTGTQADKETQLGALTPLAVLTEAEENAVDFGTFRFLPIDRPSSPQWLDGDLLYAPLYGDHGALTGVVVLDRPLDGMRPQLHKKNVLSRHADAATRAVRTVLERERLAEEVRLTELAREMVRAAAHGSSIETALATAAPAVLDVLRLDEFGVAVLEGTEVLAASYRRDGHPSGVTPGIAPRAANAGPRLWKSQRAAVIGLDDAINPPGPDVVARVREELRESGHGSALYAPIGAGSEAFGLVVLLRREGAPRWTQVEIDAALDIGRDLGLVVHNTRALQREKELAAQLRELDIARSQLVATVAHELRNPLSSVMGHLDLLESGELSQVDTVRATAAIERGASRMQRIVGDLAAFSRAGEEDTTGEFTVIDLRVVAREVVELVDAAAARRGLTITVRTGAEPAPVFGDARQLDQALVNLVSNAVKYTDVGGRVTLTVRSNDAQVEVVVQDDGIGILPEDRPQLFREFFRSTNPEALSRPGTGLGLVIARRIVERHAGTISVDSAPGEGSSFVVRLPKAGS